MKTLNSSLRGGTRAKKWLGFDQDAIKAKLPEDAISGWFGGRSKRRRCPGEAPVEQVAADVTPVAEATEDPPLLMRRQAQLTERCRSKQE